MRFEPEFFLQPTTTVARKLLGAKLITNVRGIITSGMIVEVEAYVGEGDEASHSHRGPTPRCRVMFEHGGLCYVYFIYGSHHCVNVVTEPPGSGCAVLIRALEPIEGIAAMERRRGTKALKNLTSGPGKLCSALGITSKFSGENLSTSKRIWLERFRSCADGEIAKSHRIGISCATHLEWRFFVRGSHFLSRPAD